MTWRMRLADWISGGGMWDIFMQEQDVAYHHEMASLRYRIALYTIIEQPDRAVQIAKDALGETE